VHFYTRARYNAAAVSDDRACYQTDRKNVANLRETAGERGGAGAKWGEVGDVGRPIHSCVWPGHVRRAAERRVVRPPLARQASVLVFQRQWRAVGAVLRLRRRTAAGTDGVTDELHD